MKENWKVLLKFVVILLLPLCVVQAWVTDKFVTMSMELNALEEMGMEIPTHLELPLMLHAGGFLICNLVGGVLLSSLIYSLIKLYESREDRLQNLTLAELRPLFLKNIGKMLKIVLLVIPVLVLMIALCVGFGGLVSWWTLLLTLPLFVAFLVPLLLFAPVYLNEDISLLAAFKRTYRLGFATWGGVLLIIVVMTLIGLVVRLVVYLPWQMALTINYFFAVSEGGSSEGISVGFLIFLYILALLAALVGYIGEIFGLLGMGYQYGHASEVVDNITLTDEI